jgi:hypothetical protein
MPEERDAKGKILPGAKRGHLPRKRNLSKARYADPLIKETIEIMQKLRLSCPKIAKVSGVHVYGLRLWSKGRQPTIGNLRAVLNAMGKDIIVVDKNNE